MRLFLMTDLEGVAGVLGGRDWICPEGRFYETARRLLTLEVNAAIAGFASAGFDEVLVADGHGAGAIDIELLDPRVRLARGWSTQDGSFQAKPFSFDDSFDAVAVVGQHAKAGTPFSHLTHTGWWSVIDLSINGISIGEYGELALMAGERGVPVIFASGEKALVQEVHKLTPWVITASVLEGTIAGIGDDLSFEQYEIFHEGAVHLHPQASRELIQHRAQEAGDAFCADRGRFTPLKLHPPYHVVVKLRSSAKTPAVTVEFQSLGSVASALYVERIQRIEAAYR